MKKIASYVLPAVFLMILPVIVFAGEINLPKTGQTICYDGDGNIIDCTGTGQDGDIQAGVEWPSPRFTDNGDGTVTDNLTGLMWLKDGDCFGVGRTWQGALDVVTDFNTSPLTYNCSDYMANYDDWRLPNVVELESLVNAEKSNSATWLNTQGFDNVQSSNYWSATTVATSAAYYGLYAWVVRIINGSVDGPYKFNDDNCVWPVRAGQ
jgi:hypothetical protein